MSKKEAKAMTEMSEADNIPALYQIGAKAGHLEMLDAHLPKAFNL